jgi:hypothetical protein
MSKLCSVPLIPPTPIAALPNGAARTEAARMLPLRRAPTVLQQERHAAVMALKAGFVFLVAYFGLVVAILLPAIANEAPGKYPGLWRYVHAAPNWVTPGAACVINLETHEQWLLADHAVHQLVDPAAACDEEGARSAGNARPGW